MATNTETSVSIKFDNHVTGEAKLERYAESLNKIRNITAGMDSKTIVSIEKGAEKTKDISTEASKMTRNINTAFNFGIVRQFTNGLKSAYTTLGKLTDKSSAYLENINLFQVAFNGAYQDAERFVNKMSEMYGMDESKLTNTVGIFRQLANAMNLSVETGTKLATLMTQMSVDISSLYNIGLDKASSVLQSSLAGQTKPIRGATGADITESTLQTTLDTIGLDKYVGDLSYAEKRLLIIISLTQQLSESTNDFARTIESPANQMRILNEQWERLSRAVGNVFLPVLSQVLPYLNATLMVLTEIFEIVASLLGYDSDNFDYFSGISDSALELEESLGGASENAKKLKQGLRGFDKLNVIKTPSSGDGGSGAGGINPKIMEAFNNAFDEYNSKLTDVKMKATKIRDAVMEWLGFTKEINPLTGDISWSYDGIKTTLKNMWTWFKKLKPEAKVVTALIAGFVTKSLISLVAKFVKLLGSTGLYKTVSLLLTPFKTLGQNMLNLAQYTKLYTSLTGNLRDGVTGAVEAWQRQNVIVTDSLGNINKMQTAINGSKIALQGMITAGIGLYSIHESMKSLSEEGANLYNVLGLVGGSFASIASGVQIGAVFGPMGAVIGGVAGSVLSLIDALVSYKSESELAREEIEKAIEKNNEYSESLIKQHNEIQNQIESANAMTSVHKNLVNELTQIVDANGKVKLGYEDRANFIIGTLNSAYGTEIKMVNGVIQEYDKQIEKIYELIDAKKTEIYLQKAEERFQLALDERAGAYDNLISTQKKYNDALSDLKTIEKDMKPMIDQWNSLDKNTQKAWGSFEKYVKSQGWFQGIQNKAVFYAWEKTKELVDNASEAYDNAKDSYQKNTEAIMQYQGLLSASTEQNSEKTLYWQNEIEKSYNETTKDISWTLSDRLKDAEVYYENYLKVAEENNQKITDEVKSSANERYNEVTSLLLNEMNYVEGMTDEYVDAWGTLSQLSEEKFLTNFSKLPDKIQQDVVDKMYNKGYSISEELQKGINSKNPKIKFESDLTAVKTSISSFFNKNTSLFSQVLGIKLPTIQFANGGLPPVGQLFIANERGPELIGSIGGQSFVANQNQMMDLLDRKIGNANNGMKNATFVIQVGDEVIAKKVLTDLQDMAKSDGKPIVIS